MRAMADVCCASCGEPWNTYYLRHELPCEVQATVADRRAYRAKHGINVTEEMRVALRDHAGWEFGATFLNVRRCACCPAEAVGARRPEADAAEHLLAGDADGLENELEGLN